MRRASLNKAPARLAARAAANRQARGDRAGKGRCSSANGVKSFFATFGDVAKKDLTPTWGLTPSSSADIDIARGLDQLAQAVALVRLRRQPVGRCAEQGPQELAHPHHVGAHAVDRVGV